MKLKNFLDKFPKNTQISRNIKICPVEAELSQVVEQMDGRTDGQADMQKESLA